VIVPPTVFEEIHRNSYYFSMPDLIELFIFQLYVNQMKEKNVKLAMQT